jgi:hypothetical protein
MLTNLWREAYHVVVRKDLVPSGSFEDFLALQGIKVALGERGSDGFANGQALFAAFAVDIDQAFEIVDLAGQAAEQAFLQGELDAFILKSGVDHLELLSFLDQAGDAAALLSVSDDDLDRVNQRGPEVWSAVELPPNSRAGQPAGQQTFAISYLLAAAAAVDDGAVYQITKTIFDNLPVLRGMHDATDSISLENALQRIVLPIHPGAERYYSEIGIDLPELEPVRVSNLAKTDFLTRFASIEQARLQLTDGNVSVLGGMHDQTIGRFTSELASRPATKAATAMSIALGFRLRSASSAAAPAADPSSAAASFVRPIRCAPAARFDRVTGTVRRPVRFASASNTKQTSRTPSPTRPPACQWGM